MCNSSLNNFFLCICVKGDNSLNIGEWISPKLQ